ncbi:MAG TPA: allantoicase [Thermoanaerobaculia bacterium]|nr:allantoicase [Thermoanaerobaculia bacterium]
MLAANDEFFAPKERLVADEDPVFDPHRYTDRGKWMDGWETRRRRQPGHDWCVVRLGLSGSVHGVVVDTAHFVGNYPPECSLAGIELPGHPGAQELADEALPWQELLPRSPLAGNAQNRFPLPATPRLTHLRLAIHPDGGVARLRVHGLVLPDWEGLRGRQLDLAALANGGRVLAASDMFFGARHNLILPGPPRGMHDGWETRRRRGPGHDWAVVALGAAGRVRRLEVDTTFFQGNAPGWCAVAASEEAAPAADAASWRELLPRTALQPHTRQGFAELTDVGSVRALRLDIFPDGGVARLRAWGTAE